ncbi:unnamed protein product [Urochloa humidicola]
MAGSGEVTGSGGTRPERATSEIHPGREELAPGRYGALPLATGELDRVLATGELRPQAAGSSGPSREPWPPGATARPRHGHHPGASLSRPAKGQAGERGGRCCLAMGGGCGERMNG